MADYGQFIGRLVQGESPTASSAELNALLHWLAGRRNQEATSVETAFRAHGASTDAARRQTLRYLDSTLFRRHQDYYGLFGLSADSSLSAIRARHKKLLQTFHPDRHTRDRDWFTSRTEQLNRAYAFLKKNHGKPQPAAASSRPAPAGPAAAAAPRPRAAAKTVRKQRPSPAVFKVRLRRRLQAYLGNSLRFEKRLYIALYSVPAILFLVVYLNQSHITGGIQANGGSPGSAESRVNPRESDEAAEVDGAGGKDNTGSPRSPKSPRPDLNGESGAEHRLRTLDALSPDGFMLPESMPGRQSPAMRVSAPLRMDRLGAPPGGHAGNRVVMAATIGVVNGRW